LAPRGAETLAPVSNGDVDEYRIEHAVDVGRLRSRMLRSMYTGSAFLVPNGDVPPTR
jgi:hypothetical protein